MSDLTPAQRGAYERLMPTQSGQQCIRPLALTTGAAEFDLNANWGGAAKTGITVDRIRTGGAWFSFQSSGGVAYVRAKTLAEAGTPAASAANACIVEDGRTEEFWVTSDTPLLDAVGSAAMTLKVWMSSRNTTQTVGK